MNVKSGDNDRQRHAELKYSSTTKLYTVNIVVGGNYDYKYPPTGRVQRRSTGRDLLILTNRMTVTQWKKTRKIIKPKWSS